MSLIDRLRLRLAGDSRLRRMLHGGLSGLLGRGLTILINILSVPLIVRYLGRLEYGVWVTISTSVVMFSVLDLGIANTLTNFVAEADAENDPDKAQGYFSTAFWLSLAVAAVLASAMALVWPAIHWAAVLGVTDPTLIERARICVAIAAAFFLLSLPLNLANRVLSGYQQVHVVNYFTMANSVMGLSAIVGVIFARGSIVQLMAWYCSAMLMGPLALNVWLSLRHKPWIRAHPSKVTLARARTLFGQGSLFFAIQIANLVVFNSDNLVITHYLGAAEVTPYSIAWRLTNMASMLQSIFMPAFWPAFTEAYRKQEMEWLRGTYRHLVQKTTVAVCLAAVVVGLCGRWIIAVWAGKMAIPPPLLLWTMAGWAVVVSMTTNQAVLLTAAGRLRLLAIVSVIGAMVNLTLSIFWVQRIGAEGVILATILSFAVCIAIPQAVGVRRVLRGTYFLTETLESR